VVRASQRDPATGPVRVRHVGSPPRLAGVCSRAAMRSRCWGVSGGNESTTVRTCSASTVAARSGVSGSVMLGGSPWVVRTGCLSERGSDLGESVASISGAVAVGRACSALLCVLAVLSRFFEWFGLFIRYVFLSSGQVCCRVGRLSGVSWRGLRQRARNTRPANQSARIPAWEPIS
jgi:hypothetical protein